MRAFSVRIIRAKDAFVRAWREFEVPLIFLTACALMFFLFVNFLGRDSSFAISAQTHGAEIRFTSDSHSYWQLNSTILCIRKLADAAGSVEAQDRKYCDHTLFDEISVANTTIMWKKGYVARLRKSNAASPLEIHIREIGDHPVEVNGRRLTKNSLIVIEAADSPSLGTLPFLGELTIGAEPASGTTDHLVSGRYEIRETLLGQFVPTRIREDSFFPGDLVSVVTSGTFFERSRSVAAAAGSRVTLRGFVGAPSDDDEAAGSLLVLAYSPSGRNALKIDRIGAETTFVTADWFDRALKDPWLLGLSAVFAFLAQLRAFEIGRPNRTGK